MKRGLGKTCLGSLHSFSPLSNRNTKILTITSSSSPHSWLLSSKTKDPSSRPARSNIQSGWFRWVSRYWVPFFLVYLSINTPLTATFSVRATTNSFNSATASSALAAASASTSRSILSSDYHLPLKWNYSTPAESILESKPLVTPPLEGAKTHPPLLERPRIGDPKSHLGPTDSTGNDPESTPLVPLDSAEEDEEKENPKDPTTKTGDDEDDDEMQMPDDAKFKERIESSLRTVLNWDADVELLQECRSQIPWEDLRNPEGPYSRPDEDRLLVDDSNALFLQRLCRWFPKFMTWVNAPPCAVCGAKDTEFKVVRGPETDEEKEGGAKRVEVYYCPHCDANTTTFPRYNRAKKLLETKKGRCGEYSNLFGLFCRAAGFETRLVLDLSDHLWTEVRLGDGWIMADSCEGIIDKPSMYEYGWGKKGLCYMIGITKDHVADITPRYTRKFLTDDFQTTRRSHTTSENATMSILQEINESLRRNLTKNEFEEVTRRRRLEDAELQLYKQCTEWTPQEKYGRGRISGSLAWKESRSEVGKNQQKAKDNDENSKDRQVAGFQVEAFSPPVLAAPGAQVRVPIQVRPKPSSRHDGIIVADTKCAIGEANSVSVVVLDEKCLGCILQSQSFLTWEEVRDFINHLPAHRIVAINGKCGEEVKTKHMDMGRLGGWNFKSTSSLMDGVAFIGQVDAHPDWAFCSTLEDCPTAGYEVELNVTSRPSLQLRTERYTLPHRVAGRLPESVMPLKTQLMASEEQKRLAFVSFSKSNTRYSGYTTKPKAPVYLLDSASYPLTKMEATTLDTVTKDEAWNTFHFLPSPLVPTDDEGLVIASKGADIPTFTVPLETSFFSNALGTELLKDRSTRLPTATSLHNARLVGLYFSAHWCGPCRSFTPMLAEMYEHLKEHRPSHGLEIVFVSSDRDANSFDHYFATMPWQAIPYDHIHAVKQRLNMTYGVRGIPSLVVLDAISGQVVVSPQESRQAVAMACRGGEHQIEAMLESWLDRTPQESKEMLSMLELSCQEDDTATQPKREENPYLVSENAAVPPVNAAERIKQLFDQLVEEGNDPTSAAAKAIGMLAEEQKSGVQLEAGPLDGKASRTGAPLDDNALDQAMAFAMEWNSPSLVTDVLTTSLKYLKNAMKEPWSPKYRSFKLSNKVADHITKIEGGIALLQALGFEVFGTSQEFKATIPLSRDLEDMNQTISRLIDGLTE